MPNTLYKHLTLYRGAYRVTQNLLDSSLFFTPLRMKTFARNPVTTVRHLNDMVSQTLGNNRTLVLKKLQRQLRPYRPTAIRAFALVISPQHPLLKLGSSARLYFGFLSLERSEFSILLDTSAQT